MVGAGIAGLELKSLVIVCDGFQILTELNLGNTPIDIGDRYIRLES